MNGIWPTYLSTARISRAGFILTSLLGLTACGLLPYTQPKLQGSVSGRTYSSPSGLFKVEIPLMANPFVKTPLMADFARKDPFVMEQVGFIVPDLGELYIAGVRRIPGEVLSAMERSNHRENLGHMADQTLLDWRPLPKETKPFEDKFVSTRFGEALVRVYLSPKGSALISATNRKPTKEDTFDTLIAVLVARKESWHLYVITEFDSMMTGLTGLHAPGDNPKIATWLSDRAIHLLGTMILTQGGQ